MNVTTRERGLEAMRRLREFELNEARTEHASAEEQLVRARESVRGSEQALQQAEENARGVLMTSGALAVDLMEHARAYAALLRGEHTQHVARLSAAEARCEQTRVELTRRRTVLGSIERLLARRAEQTAEAADRTTQTNLDDWGASRDAAQRLAASKHQE